jgi:hypothetical protein
VDNFHLYWPTTPKALLRMWITPRSKTLSYFLPTAPAGAHNPIDNVTKRIYPADELLGELKKFKEGM